MNSITLELDDVQLARLDGLAASLGTSRTGASERLLEEETRRRAFPGIEFRDSAIGRLPYVAGSSLAVWEVVMVAQAHADDKAATASHLDWPQWRVEQALAYADAFPLEGAALAEANRAVTKQQLKAMLPPGVWRETEPV